MNYQREGLLLPERTETSLDDAIYRRFEEVHEGARETYKQLTLDADRKPDVLAAWHDGENADLSATHVDLEALEARINQLYAWKAELLEDAEMDPELKQAYRWRINEDIANAKLVEASARGDMEMFHRWNRFIYGEPDEAVYRGALDKVAHDAEVILAGEDVHPATAAAAQEVLEMLEGKRGYRELLAPTEEAFQAVRDDHLRAGGYYALLLAGADIPKTGKINREAGDPILEHVVTNNLQSDYTLSDAEASSWGVTHSTKSVERPANYNMPWQRFVGLGAGHEIGSHLLEKMNGRRGPVGLMADGLDRYESGNEGRAVMREQVVYEIFDEFGKLVRWRDIIRRDIAIGYAMGVGEDGMKPSSDVYAFVNTIDRMYQAKLTPDDPETTTKKAQAKTDTLLARILKGTDGTGGAYLKDKVYLEGHVACWLTAAERGAERVSEGDLGKFDITNPRHIALLQSWGLLPDNE